MYVYNEIWIKVKLWKLNKYIGYEKKCYWLLKFECFWNINIVDIFCVDMYRSSSIGNK